MYPCCSFFGVSSDSKDLLLCSHTQLLLRNRTEKFTLNHRHSHLFRRQDTRCTRRFVGPRWRWTWKLERPRQRRRQYSRWGGEAGRPWSRFNTKLSGFGFWRVHAYVYVYACIVPNMLTHKHTHTHTHVHEQCTYIHIYVYMYICIYVIYTYIYHMNIHPCAYVYTHIYIFIFIYNIYKYILVYMHI